MNKPSNILIFMLSSKGKLSLDEFNALFRQTCPPEEGDEDFERHENKRRQARRLLESLGYCEFDYKNRSLYVCPPSLVLIPSCTMPTAILTGARSPRLINQIKTATKERKDRCHISDLPQNTKAVDMPTLVKIESCDIETIKEIAETCGIECKLDCPAAWSLIHFSASMQDIEQNLKFEARVELNWSRKEIYLAYLKKLEPISNPNGKISDFRLIRYQDPISKQYLFWLWNGNQAAQVEDTDWGRYILLRKLSIKVLLYDSKSKKLAVPLLTPLPNLLARASALCSGIAPWIVKLDGESLGDPKKDIDLYLYHNIPENIASILAGKLGQELILVNMHIEKDRLRCTHD